MRTRLCGDYVAIDFFVDTFDNSVFFWIVWFSIVCCSNNLYKLIDDVTCEVWSIIWSKCDSATFLPSLVPYGCLYMWLRVLLTSHSLLAYLATLACRVLHLCKLTLSHPRCKLIYLPAAFRASLDYSKSTGSAFPSKFYYLALFCHLSIQLEFCSHGPPIDQKSFQSIWLENSGSQQTLSNKDTFRASHST